MIDARDIRWFTYPTDYGYVVHARIIDPVSLNQAGLERHFSFQEMIRAPKNIPIDLERMQRRLMEFVA